MRELKFRAWDNGKIVYDIIWPYIEDQPLQDFFNDDRWILMQYTGLKDKNGKEIYDGDILEYSYYHDWGQGGEMRFAIYPEEVKWLPISTGFNPLRGWSDYGGQLKTCEVIGNIYENPELLGETK